MWRNPGALQALQGQLSVVALIPVAAQQRRLIGRQPNVPRRPRKDGRPHAGREQSDQHGKRSHRTTRNARSAEEAHWSGSYMFSIVVGNARTSPGDSARIM